MSAAIPATNGVYQHWIVAERDQAGQFTARVPGIPELRATAPTREDAIKQIPAMLTDWLTRGRLVSIEVSADNPLLCFSGHLDPNDLLEKEFVEELARRRREDLVNTLREDDQECSNSSSTPTT